MPLFQGLVAFPITPMDIDGRVDGPALRTLVRRLCVAGVDSIGLLGSTGGYAYLTRDQRRRAIEIAVAEADGAVSVMAGVGALRADDALRHAEDARATGAAAGLLAPMSYTPLLDDEVFGLFEGVAQAKLPLCIYNNPGVTHFTFSDDLIVRISGIEGVRAVKNPAPDGDAAGVVLTALRARAPDGFSLGVSGDGKSAEAMLAGADAWYSVAGGLFPAPVLELARAAAGGDAERTHALNARLQPLWDLFTRYSGFRVVHAAAGLMDLSPFAPPRPILPLSKAAQAEVKTVLERLDRLV